MMHRSIMMLSIMILALPLFCLAAPQEFIENYTYIAGEADSKLTCRTISLIEVKRLLLEKIGTYIESRTEVKDFHIEKDEIVALTAGIVKLEILDEKWNGERYILTAKIEADASDIARAIEDLRKRSDTRQRIDQYNKINDESLEQLREMQARMQQLQSDLIRLNQDTRASQGLLNSWGMYEEAVKLRQSGKFEAAVNVLNTVIENNPTHLAYFERGLAHLEAGRYHEAITDLTETLKTDPNLRGALWHRGMAYMKSNMKKKGRRDIEKAAALGQNRAKKWLKDHPGPGKG